MDEFLTVSEVANLLKLNQQTVRNWIDAGRLPALKVGRRVRGRREDLERLLEASVMHRPAGEPGASIWDGEVPPPANPFHPTDPRFVTAEELAAIRASRRRS